MNGSINYSHFIHISIVARSMMDRRISLTSQTTDDSEDVFEDARETWAAPPEPALPLSSDDTDQETSGGAT